MTSNSQHKAPGYDPRTPPYHARTPYDSRNPFDPRTPHDPRTSGPPPLNTTASSARRVVFDTDTSSSSSSSRGSRSGPLHGRDQLGPGNLTNWSRQADLSDDARFKGQLKEFQRIVDSEQEDPAKAKIIHIMNSMCAHLKPGVVLRFPRYHPWCEYHWFRNFVWTDDHVEVFKASGKLPINFQSFASDPKDINLWVIDASPAAPREVFMDPVPDFQKEPAVCLFDVGQEGRVQIIPSMFLRVNRTGEKKVQFVVRPSYHQVMADVDGQWAGILDMKNLEVGRDFVRALPFM